MSLLLPVSRQGLAFLLAGALGLALGFWYDLLRLLRLRHAFAADGLMALSLFAVLAGFVLYFGDGLLRGFVPVALMLGASGYFLVLSPLLRPPLEQARRGLKGLGALMRVPGRWAGKKLFSFAKKLFHSLEKWFRMVADCILQHFSLHRKGGSRYEAEQVHAAHQVDRSDPGCVRYHYPA